jgi:hypothetical protein
MRTLARTLSLLRLSAAGLTLFACSNDTPPSEEPMPRRPTNEYVATEALSERCGDLWTYGRQVTEPAYLVEYCHHKLAEPSKRGTAEDLLFVSGRKIIILDEAAYDNCNPPIPTYEVSVTDSTLALRIFPRHSLFQPAPAFDRNFDIHPPQCDQFNWGIKVTFQALLPGTYNLRLENYQHSEGGVVRRQVKLE